MYYQYNINNLPNPHPIPAGFYGAEGRWSLVEGSIFGDGEGLGRILEPGPRAQAIPGYRDPLISKLLNKVC